MELTSALNLNSPSSTSPRVLPTGKNTSSENSIQPHRTHNHLHLHLPHLGKMHHSLHLHLHLPHFPLHLHSKKGGGQDFYKDVPKGCLALYVGQEGEEQQRFVIPVEHVNHPLFEKLLKEAEEEYGFEQKGTITIPCHVSDFQRVHDLIDREQHHSHAHGGCFR